MLKSGNQERICSAVGFSEELIEVFKLKKYLKVEPKMTKNPKFSNFQFLCNYCRNFDRLRRLEC